LGGSGVEALVGVFVGSWCGFRLNLHVEFCKIDRFSLIKKQVISCVVEDAEKSDEARGKLTVSIVVVTFS
jgi:hypothetical protein